MNRRLRLSTSRAPLAPRARRAAALVAAPVLLSGLLAGCGGDEESPAPDDAPAQDAAQEAPRVSPLTGLEVTGKSPKNPVVVTKIDNTSSAAPQAGVGSADMVVEELVEGGVTRLAAFYWSKLPERVGPVRSMRASDIGIVGPADGTVVTSGAAPVTINRIKGAGIPFISEGARGIFRDPARPAPYNLFANLDQALASAKKAQEPEAYFDFGTGKDLPKGRKATSINASFGSHTSTWAFQQGEYVNTNSLAAEGDRFDADTVLVLRVQVGDAGYKDPGGNFVPETKFEGKGDALLFHDGRAVKGTWSKDRLEGHLTLKAAGKELTVPAGHTWVELVPAQEGDVTYGK